MSEHRGDHSGAQSPAGESAYFGTSSHTDNSFFEKPSALTILFSERVPPTSGDEKYKGETAISYTYSDRVYEANEHPVMRTHPETGRKSLFVNPRSTTITHTNASSIA